MIIHEWLNQEFHFGARLANFDGPLTINVFLKNIVILWLVIWRILSIYVLKIKEKEFAFVWTYYLWKANNCILWQIANGFVNLKPDVNLGQKCKCKNGSYWGNDEEVPRNFTWQLSISGLLMQMNQAYSGRYPTKPLQLVMRKQYVIFKPSKDWLNWLKKLF